MSATDPQTIEKINNMFDSISPMLEQMAARWSSESQYEDINDYALSISKVVEEHKFKLIKVTKRPFGFHFNVGTPSIFSVYCTAKQIGWKRIK